MLLKALIIIALILRLGGRIADAVWSMLSDDGKGVSSKRVIAIATTISFIHISYMSVDCAKRIDSNVLWAHVVIILTAAAIASMSQITSLLTIAKGGKIDTLDTTTSTTSKDAQQ